MLRSGAVTIEQIRRVLPDARDITDESDRHAHESVRSPGTMHPHYQPHAKVRLVDSPNSVESAEGARVAYCGLLPIPVKEQNAFVLSAVFSTLDDYAAAFYEFLREADRLEVSMIYVQGAPNVGIGRALLDRQLRAAGER